MNAMDAWVERYQRDHTHPMNRATHMVGIPMILVSLPALLVSWQAAVGLFVLGWILQFIGHAFEGKPPSFFSDPRFLVVGAAWYVRKVVGALTGRSAEQRPG